MYPSNQARRNRPIIPVHLSYPCPCGPAAAYRLADVRLLGLGPSRSSSWQLVSDCSGSVSIGSPTQGIINLSANVADISTTLPKR